MKFIAINDKSMSNGMRNMTRTPLTEKEIEHVKSEIKRIEADEAVFIFNDEEHIPLSTCYNYLDDKIYVTKNVLPDISHSSTQPRDIMSIGAVLAHAYYGHRTFRDEYLEDYNKSCDADKEYHTTPIWKDECRASITAAKITPNLSEKERSNLVEDAIYRAEEFGHYLKMDSFMKEVVYGYSEEERSITNGFEPITYIVKNSEERIENDGGCNCSVPKVRRKTKDNYDFER